ncbi:segregation and condensation protein A [Arthrobacter sp. KK5.5]|uniref:segregation and condensation protein A n=1 Tax=Arthrobacter sp. KK5.5 TaxID=3373084 RepID=UPI003EE59BA6
MTTGGAETAPPATVGFAVNLANFSGPFDLLLGLISKHRLDITEVSLARVTDEFIAYIREVRERGGEKALDETTQFLVMASTLLDLKAARLLPSGEVESDEDIALLEARDLLFARLLQYKAFKVVAGELETRLELEADRFPRQVSLEPRFSSLLPELLWKTSAAEFADLARRALAPKPARETEVGLSHLHAPAVSVREQAEHLAEILRSSGRQSFRTLIADAGSRQVVVARFLALLEMFRDHVVAFDQVAPLGELEVRWNAHGTNWSPDLLREEYDTAAEPAGAATEGAP